MKKILAILSVAALLVSFASCGKDSTGAQTTAASETAAETTISPTQPEVGRVKEMEGFYVYTPESWCQMTYKGDGYRIELFDIPSAPDIVADTPSVEIILESETASKETLDANVKALLAKEGAKKAEGAKIDGYEFTAVTYTVEVEKVEKKTTKKTTKKATEKTTDKAEKTTAEKTTKKAEPTTEKATEKAEMVKVVHTVYTGLVGNKISTVTLKGISATDEDAAAILKSISYK